MTRTPAQSAEVAAEAVRDLNTLTRHPVGAYEYPSEVSAVLGSLSELATRLPQALDQASAWLVRADREGRLTSDTDTAPDAQVDMAAYALADARALAGQLTAALRTATSHAAHLGGVA